MDYYINILKKRLKPARFSHSLLVRETALQMGAGFNLNQENLGLAALLHDYAKNLTPLELLAVAREHDLITERIEEWQPQLLHGPVGAFLCQRDLQITEPEILQAIRYHTTGHAEMSLLDKIVFLADLLEPSRNYAGLVQLRNLCAVDLDKGLLLTFKSILQYLLQKELLIHPLTVRARNRLLEELKTKDEKGGIKINA